MTALEMSTRVATLVLLSAAIGACGDGRLSPPIEAWLLCDECTNGERATVRALGDAAVLDLGTALLDGPPGNIRDFVRRQAITAHSKAGVGTDSSNKYAARMVDNYVAKYESRAAIALGDIGTPQAKSILDAALEPRRRSQYRDDVWRTIRAARMAIDAVSFGGKFERPILGFGDTAFLLAPPARPFTTNDMVTFDDMPFAPANLFLSRTPGRLGFAAAGATGSHVIAVRTLGTGRTELASFFIASIADPNDRATQNCQDRACEISNSPIIPPAALPYNSFLSLHTLSSKPDTVDMFRFMSGPVHVTATLNWSGPANLDLLWRSCSVFDEVGNSDGATPTTKPEVTIVDIPAMPANECWLLLVVLKTKLPGPVFAHLHVQ